MELLLQATVFLEEEKGLDLLHAERQPLVAFRPFGLAMEGVALPLDLVEDILDPEQILLRSLESPQGGIPIHLVRHDPRRLL